MASAHRFTAYASEVDRCRAHGVPEAEGFLEAAILFAESWAADAGEVSVTVVDADTGERQCFRIDLDTGDAAPC